MSGMADWQAKISIDIDDLKKRIKVAEGELDKVTKEDRKIKLDFNTKTLESAIQKLDKMLDSLGKGTGDFKQFENLSKELSAITSEVKDFSKAFGKLDDSGAKTLLSSIQNIDRSLSDLSQHILNVNKNMGNMGNNTSGAVKQVENIGNAAADAVKQVNKLADAQSKLGNKTNISSGMKDPFPSTEIPASVDKLEQVSNANKEVQKAVETSTLAIKENAKAIDNGELPALDELVKKANEAAYELTKGKDIVSQIGKKQVYKVTETDGNGKTMERIVGQFSYVEKSLDGQLKNVLATYDESTGRWNEEVLSLATNFEKVGKEIISLDNKINKLEMHRDKMASEHPNYDTSADDELIDVQKSRRFVLEQTLGLYANEKEYVYEIDAFEKRRIENNRTLLALKEQQNNSQKVKTDEKADKQLVKDWEDAIKFNQEYDTALEKTNELLSKLSVPKELESQWLELIDYADKLRTKLANNEIGLSDYKSSIKSKLSEYNSNVGIQQKRDIDEYNSNVKTDNAKKLEREKQIWNELTTSLDRYATLQKRIANNNALSTDNKEAAKLLKYIYELQKSDVLPSEKLNASNEKLQQIKQTVTDLKAKLKESTLDSLQGSIDKYQKIYDQRSTYSSDFTPSDQYTKNLTELNTAIKNLVEYRNTLKNVSEVTVEQETHLKGLVTACEKASDSFKSLSASEKGASQIAVDKLVQRINKDLDECTNYSKEAKLGLRALRDELESANPRNLKEITSEIINIENAEIRAGRAGKSLWDTFKTSRLHQIVAQAAGMFGFYDIINIGKQAVEIVTELDSAFTEMRKVSDETEQSLKRYQQTTFTTADAIGTTAVQIQKSTANWQRLGYSLDEASKLAENSNIYKNVGDMDINEATEHMISSVQAWKSEFGDAVTASEEIMNRYNKIGNEFAISSADIGEAMETSAAALKAGGNDLNESIGLITAGNLIQQDASTTASAMKILSLRIRGAKADLDAMGESTDDLSDSTSKMREELKALTGVDIMKDENTFKSTAEIIQEMGKNWDKLTDVSKAAALEKLAGKNRASTVSGLIENYETIGKVIEAAENSENSALEENEKYLESIEGRTQKLTNQLQELASATIKDDWIKDAISGLTTLLDLVTKLVDKFGIIPTVAPAIAAALSFKNVGILELN